MAKKSVKDTAKAQTQRIADNSMKSTVPRKPKSTTAERERFALPDNAPAHELPVQELQSEAQPPIDAPLDNVGELGKVIPAAPVDRATRAVHEMIGKLEKQAKGHGADSDRETMKDAAQLIRYLVGLGPTDELSHLPKPEYGPVRNDPPIGHSLPYTLPGDSDR